VSPLVLLAALVPFLLARVQDDAPPDRFGPPEEFIPRLATAAAQLDHARELKGQRDVPLPAQRLALTERAIEAYRSVRRYHPEAAAIGAEAAFRAGRLLAPLGRVEEALAELRFAVRLGQGTEFRARAGLETGRLQRLSGRIEPALDAFLAVAADDSGARVHRDEAWLRAGDVWSELGETERAWRAWSLVAGDAEDPVDRVAAFDRLGSSLVEDDDLEGAAGILNRCLRSLAPDALQETERGARVRRALRNMRLVASLPLSVARRNAARAAETSPRKP